MKFKLLKYPSVLMLSFCLLIMSLDVKAADIYVSNSGSNSNSGTFASPYLTIQTALNVAGAGDNIYVRGGTYAEKIWWPSSGTSGNPITLTNYNGESAVISGVNPTNSTQGAFILISSQSYIRINGLVFRDNIMNYADGVYMTGSGTDVHVTNCEFDNIGWTTSKTTFPTPSNSAHAIIFVGSGATSISNIFIGGNYIHDCITGYSESVTIAGNVESFLVEGNTLNSNTNIGIDAAGHFTWTGAPANVNYARSGIIRDNVVSNYAGPAALDAAGGIYTDGGSYITIENNIVYNYKVGFSVGCEVPGNTNTGNIIRNNLAYDCSLSGLFLGSNTTSVVNNTQVYNNTFYECGTGIFDNGQIALQNNAGSDIRNNILFPTSGRYAMVQMGGTTTSSSSIAYNLLWRADGTSNNMFLNITNATNSVLANPQFSNASANDYHLSSSSPAINAGDPSYSPASTVYDLDGTARVQGGRVDIGVDESGSGSSTVSVTGVSMTPASATLNVGGTQQLSATISPSNATNQGVGYSSSNTSIATVNSSGLVTAQSAGSATITVSSSDGNYTDTSSITVNNSGGSSLPSPWVSSDIGAVGATGTANYSGSTFTIEGSGSDIWSTADEFRFVYQSLSGDGTITARVASIENTNNWAKAGVMIRESLNAGSKHAMSIVASTSGVSFQRRTATNGSSAHTTTSGLSDPYWVRIVRVGNNFTSYFSANGSSWTNQGSATISMNSSVYIGLVTTSHADGTLCTSTMDNVSVDTGAATTTTPVAGKTYYIDNPHHDLRLGANGGEDAYTTSTSTTGANVEWVITASPTSNHYYIDCNGGGSKPRIRTDRTQFADMQGTGSAGTYTRWSFTASGGAFLLTTQDQVLPRLQVNNSGQVKMVTTASAATWERFTFTEVTNPSSRSIASESVKNELEAISVFPVPARHTINIVLPSFEDYLGLEINDVTGRVVLEKRVLTSDDITLDINGLKPGMFIINAYHKDGYLRTMRFMKK